MHELFHTADPAFAYMNEESRLWVQRFQNTDPSLPSQHAVVTLDAGANVHVFVPENEEKMWTRFFEAKPNLKFVKSKSGKGARYVDDTGI